MGERRPSLLRQTRVPSPQETADSAPARGWEAAPASGRSSEKVDPFPGRDRALMSPPMARANSRAMNRLLVGHTGHQLHRGAPDQDVAASVDDDDAVGGVLDDGLQLRGFLDQVRQVLAGPHRRTDRSRHSAKQGQVGGGDRILAARPWPAAPVSPVGRPAERDDAAAGLVEVEGRRHAVAPAGGQPRGAPRARLGERHEAVPQAALVVVVPSLRCSR